MSSEMVFFSSSSRSMRSMMALSWSLANFVAGASLTAAAVVAIGYSWMELKVDAEGEAPHAFPRTASQHDPKERAAWRQGNIALIHSAPTEEREKLLPLPSLSEATKQFSLLSLWLSSRSMLSRVASRDPLARKDGKTSMPALGFFHRRELLGTGLALKSR